MDPVTAVVGAFITLIGVVVAGYFTYRASIKKLRSDSGQQAIDQYQEDIAEMRKEITQLKRQVRIQGDYIGQLRRHIADGQPPPPPPWPEGLIT